MRSLSILAFCLATLFTASTVRAGCSHQPPQAAVKKALEYYKTNQSLIEHSSRTMGEPGRKIVINDYSGTDSATRMYILNSDTGVCEDESVVGFGGGKSGDKSLKGGCIHESRLAPSGFHITAVPQINSKYTYPRGLTMLPCEGQEATGPRGIMIHGAAPPPSGTHGGSWGCATLPVDIARDWIPNKIKGGSLVYNYWGEDKDSDLPGCDKVGSSQTCSLPSGSGGGADSGGRSPAFKKDGAAR